MVLIGLLIAPVEVKIAILALGVMRIETGFVNEK